ncbi:MAG: hypothetical protein ACO20H_06930 [Bacteriovoracaceae bacterium]
MEEFINTIIKNLESNGFPQKRVALPLEKMYEIADQKELNFNKVLEELSQKGISHSKEGDRIIFSQDTMPNFDHLAEMMNGKNPGDLMKMAQEMMAKMSPEQQEEIKNRVMNMDPKEREELMNKAKDMGMT